VFDHLDQAPWAWSQSDRRLAETMSDYWVNFAETGNPNRSRPDSTGPKPGKSGGETPGGGNLPRWKPFAGDSGPVQYLGETITSGVMADTRKLQVLDTVYSGFRH